MPAYPPIVIPEAVEVARIYQDNLAQKGTKVVPDTEGEDVQCRTSSGAGKFEAMKKIPLEIFLEIAFYLLPLDILFLSRVSKHLRATLLSRTSRRIWIAARQNVFPLLPECPEFISEPEYAHVLFEWVCEACLSPSAPNLFFSVPVRLCDLCCSANLRRGCTRGVDPPMPALYELLPAVALDQMWDLSDCGRTNYPENYYYDCRYEPRTEPEQSHSDMFYRPEFIALRTQFSEVLGSNDAAAIQRFIDAHRALTVRRINFALAVEKWYGDFENMRINAVAEKLEQISHSYAELPSRVEVSRLIFTEQDWEVLLPKLRAAIENQPSREVERRALKRMYYDFVHEEGDIAQVKRTLPCFADAMRMRCMRSFEARIDTLGLRITKEEFNAISTDILAEAAPYRAEIRHILNSELPDQIRLSDLAPPNDGGFGALEMPFVLFKCYGPFPDTSDPAPCLHIFSHIGMLEHWQDVHRDEMWSRASARAALDLCDAWINPLLLAAIGLPRDATMTAVEERVRSGHAHCSCGVEILPEAAGKKPELMLSGIILHLTDMSVHQSDPPYPTIEFKPLDRSSASIGSE
ncbi:hypothetical protein BD413DRAFT_27747 [Trametes elegans]|nr:hypothetical protein BD413DRAFT_27747 [Trametes elegans]